MLPPPSLCFGSDLRKFKEAKKQFDKVSEEKEAALIKNAQAPRNKQHEVEEATNILTATRKCFRHIVLDYVLQVGQVCSDVCDCPVSVEEKASSLSARLRLSVLLSGF